MDPSPTLWEIGERAAESGVRMIRYGCALGGRHLCVVLALLRLALGTNGNEVGVVRGVMTLVVGLSKTRRLTSVWPPIILEKPLGWKPVFQSLSCCAVSTGRVESFQTHH